MNTNLIHSDASSRHRPSPLLTNDENASVISLLGPRCPSLATSVVQLYESQSHTWRPRLNCGVICFVKDNVQRSYYLRVVDLRHGRMALNQEIYSQFTYKTPKAWFHTFEGDSAVYGLNFANEKEALLFKNILETNLRERRLRKERRNAQKRNICAGGGNPSPAAPTPPPPPPPPTMMMMPAHTHITANPYKQLSKNHSSTFSKRKLKKEDISRPTNFKHISHVGWDPNKGFDLENVDPKLLKFFSKAGVSERELKNKKTRDFIYQFIDDHGGVEAAIQEVDKKPLKSAPPPPPSITQQQQHSAVNAPAPPPRQSSIGRPLLAAASIPPPPSRIHILSANKEPVPAIHNKEANKASTPPLPPPPPPPPPPVPQTKPSPPPIINNNSDARSNLLAEIRKGGNALRHVTEEDRKAAGSSNNRDDLMSEIRSGITLKKVDNNTLNLNSQHLQNNEAEPSGIAGLLQRALKERLSAVGFSSSDSEGEAADDEDDEWD